MLEYSLYCCSNFWSSKGVYIQVILDFMNYIFDEIEMCQRWLILKSDVFLYVLISDDSRFLFWLCNLGYACQRPLARALTSCACRELLFIKLIRNIIWKTGISETGITGVGTRDAGTSEFSNSKTRTLETGITGGFPLYRLWNIDKCFCVICNKTTKKNKKPFYKYIFWELHRQVAHKTWLIIVQ
jgi:hypothetical protein